MSPPLMWSRNMVPMVKGSGELFRVALVTLDLLRVYAANCAEKVKQEGESVGILRELVRAVRCVQHSAKS